jgi:DNA-binding MarR family transcriptional regulator
MTSNTTSEEPQSLIESAAEIRQGVMRLAQQMTARRSPGALSVNKLSALSYLRRHGPTTPGELAAAQHQQPQSLTRVLAELETDELVSRDRDDLDRRHSVIDITPAGFRALARDMGERDTWLASAIAGLTETERQVLVLAGRLMDQVADAEPGTPRYPAGHSSRAENGVAPEADR